MAGQLLRDCFATRKKSRKNFYCIGLQKLHVILSRVQHTRRKESFESLYWVDVTNRGLRSKYGVFSAGNDLLTEVA